MAKAEEFVSPANLWGKPLPGSTSKAPKEKKEEKVTRMRTEDYDDEDVDADVDAELEEDMTDDDAAAYAAAEADYANENGEDIRETAAKLTDEEVAAGDDDEDETEYEPEEGDEVSDDAVDSAVEVDEDDEPVEAPTATKTTNRKVKDMAEKKSGADHIRDEIERRQASGDSLRGVDIVAALAKKRVVVSPAQVSQLLKKAGVAPGKRGMAVAAGEERSRDAARRKHAKAPEPAKIAPKRPVAKAPTGSTTLPMGQLNAAAAFLAACDGCYDTASEILAAHKQLRTMMAS